MREIVEQLAITVFHNFPQRKIQASFNSGLYPGYGSNKIQGAEHRIFKASSNG
jgi:hypothetical protein